MQVEAIYEHGVLRPLTPLELAESQRVTVFIAETASGPSQLDRSLMEQALAEVAVMSQRPTIEAVRRALAKIPGSLVDDVIAQREDR